MYLYYLTPKKLLVVKRFNKNLFINSKSYYINKYQAIFTSKFDRNGQLLVNLLVNQQHR